jgi:signal transduction histidine kinase
MKSGIKIILFLVGCVHYGFAQDSPVLLSAKMFTTEQLISLSGQDGWRYREGNDISWAKRDLDTNSWKKLKPEELSAKYADNTGRIEGWFRLKFKLDSSFNNIPLGIQRGGWAATDIYIDGNFFASFGNTGQEGNRYEEYNPIDKYSLPLNLSLREEHLIAMHFVDRISSIPPRQLKSEVLAGPRPKSVGLFNLLRLAGPSYNVWVEDAITRTLKYRTIWLSVTALLAFLFWLLAFQNLQERRTLFLIALCVSFSALSNLCRFYFADPEVSFLVFRISDLIGTLSIWVFYILIFLIVTRVLHFNLSKWIQRFLIGFSFLGVFVALSTSTGLYLQIVSIIGFFIFLYIIFSSWKKLRGAQWAIVTGLSLTVLFAGVTMLLFFLNMLPNGSLLLLSGVYLSIPFSLLAYVSLRFREIIREVRENARQVVEMTEEKKGQAIKQKVILEEEVARQTLELRTTLENLKSTQTQLIQSEKMASLGELTAGIAHEIQNPLNFVNNFSEVNAELIQELKGEAEKGNLEEVKGIAKEIEFNSEKINHHGKRADAIVKGMLLHSRSSSGIKEPTDINALANEYLRLSYHGLRAKDKSFNATMKTDFDDSIGKINIIPQDIGRVVLNLINNAFYAVGEKKKHTSTGSAQNGYEPTVSVSTKKTNGKVEIKVADNGNGIPQKVLDKIFQPFFTTKPTGQGTGLGLSLSYDIVKAHGGEIKVKTEENEGTEFIIQLPFA